MRADTLRDFDNYRTKEREEMKRIRILLFYGLSKEPVIKIDCWEYELKKFLEQQDRDIYRIEIIEL